MVRFDHYSSAMAAKLEPQEDSDPHDALLVGINDGKPKMQDETIGPEDARFRLNLPVIRVQFQGQRSAKEPRTWLVRANTRYELQENLFKLAQPYLRRAIEFPTMQNPCWSEKKVPTKEDLSLYLMFRDNSRKRTFKFDQIEDEKFLKWTNQSNLLLLVYEYSYAVHSRGAWELVTEQLLKEHKEGEPRKQILIGEDLKLDVLLKRLKKVHGDKLIPKVDDAFEQWATWILKAPHKRQSNLSYSFPPGDLLKNFQVVKASKSTDKLVIRQSARKRRQYISGPAQREHTSDGFGFEDEVNVLRQTVTQIKDLVEMLDHRVCLLEQKCQGFKQAVNGGGEQSSPKRARLQENDGSDDDNTDEDDDQEEDKAVPDEEPLVDEEENDRFEEQIMNFSNPDPLLFNDLVERIKEETALDIE